MKNSQKVFIPVPPPGHTIQRQRRNSLPTRIQSQIHPPQFLRSVPNHVIPVSFADPSGSQDPPVELEHAQTITDLLNKAGIQTVIAGGLAVKLQVRKPRQTFDIDYLINMSSLEAVEILNKSLQASFRTPCRLHPDHIHYEYKGYKLDFVDCRSMPVTTAAYTTFKHKRIGSIKIVERPGLVIMKLVSLASEGRGKKQLTDMKDMDQLLLELYNESRRVYINHPSSSVYNDALLGYYSYMRYGNQYYTSLARKIISFSE